MDKLVNDLDAYLVDLSELEVSNRRLIEETRGFADFIDEHVLWIRSADALQLRDVVSAVQALRGLARVKPWIKLVTNSGWDALRRPLIATSVLISAVLLITFHTRLRRRVGDLCESRSCSAGTRFGPTIEALLVAAVVAAEWPLLAFYFGWQMTITDQTTDLGLAVGPTLAVRRCALLVERICPVALSQRGRRRDIFRLVGPRAVDGASRDVVVDAAWAFRWQASRSSPNCTTRANGPTPWDVWPF